MGGTEVTRGRFPPMSLYSDRTHLRLSCETAPRSDVGAAPASRIVFQSTPWSFYCRSICVWGRDGSGNLYSPERSLPATFDPGKFKRGTEEINMATTKNVRWAAKLGSQAYGNTTVANGKVYVGTNNETPRD